jgi:hypothetical protein
MPWKVRKRKCRQGDGDKGKYVVVKVKRGGGTEQSSCHTTKNLAKRATRARYASAYGESVMKITAEKLRQIIREEAQKLVEVDSLKPGDYALGAYFSVEKMDAFKGAMLDLFDDALRSASNDLGDPTDAHDAVMAGFEKLIKGVQSGMRPLEIDDALRKEIQQSVDTLANEEVFRDASAEDVAMQSLDYVDHPPSLADEAYEIALAAALKMGIPREGR